MYQLNIFNYSLYNIVYLFLIYSFLGWLSEVSYAYKHQKKFVNRGFLNGPYCPIYGVGCLTLVVFLNGLKDNIFLLFIGAVVLTSVLEYVTAIVLEFVFKDSWWDYTEDPFNVKGRICLGFSLMWGLCGLIVVKFINPIIELIINSMPLTVGNILLDCFVIYFVVDFISTFFSEVSLKSLMTQLSFRYFQLKSKLKFIK